MSRTRRKYVRNRYILVHKTEGKERSEVGLGREIKKNEGERWGDQRSEKGRRERVYLFISTYLVLLDSSISKQEWVEL